MIRFSLFAIPVEIQPFFWVTLVLLGGVNGVDTAAEIFKILIFVVAGTISILVHEFGHALAARKYGASVYIVLQAFGGYAAYSGAQMSRVQSFLITGAGPAIQIALAAVAYAIHKLLPNINETGTYFLEDLIGISLFWAILNLLPVMPLDGGQMLNATLGPKRIKITLWITIIVSAAVGTFIFMTTRSIIFPIFLGMFAWQAFQALQENRLR
jgi:stage IV sporulation protein FB